MMPTGENFHYWLHELEILLPWIVIAIAASMVITAIVILTLDLLNTRRLFRQKVVLLELTPPANANKTPEATKHLFTVLHGLEASRTLLEKLTRRKVIFSLEIVSTKQEGIRYVLRMPESDVLTFEHTIHTYIPDAKLRSVSDFLPEVSNGRVLELNQTGHFAYPFESRLSLDQHDPIAYLTGMMTKLLPDELIAFQIVVSPAKIREAMIITSRMMLNDELVYQLGKRKPLFGKLFNAVNAMLFGILDGVGDAVSGPSNYKTNHIQTAHNQQVALKMKPARVLSQFEQQLAESVHDKLSQPLFKASIRVLVAINDDKREKQRIKGVREWMASLAVPKYQSLKVRRKYSRLQEIYRTFKFIYRLPSFFQRTSCVLSAAELADLYHFPHTQAAKTENVVKSLSKTLPAPISLKQDKKLDVIIGQNEHHGTRTAIGLTQAERERHLYIIGGTGNGKTTILQYAIVQDMQSGKGLAVVDPHGDMAETLLSHVPKDRLKDVVYFNPDDLEYPIGLNLLELTPGLIGNELLREKDLITESVISVFRKIFSEEDTGGHRIEYVLRNTVQTALTVPDATLFTIFDLLNDPKYRKSVIRTLEDKNLKNFWRNELGKAGDMQKVKMAAGITAKIGRFLFSASAKQILEQPRSTIDFDEIINSGKILICNFSKGLLGEDTSELFGITVLAKLQLASLRRARLRQQERSAFYLYVDEFQNFATPSFVQMLSESRKYRLYMTMAEQSTSQQKDQQMVSIILANVGTVICFRTGNPNDERLLLPLFSPYVEQGEISNLPAFNYYAKLSAIQAQEPLSGHTLLLKEAGNNEIASIAIDMSRVNYAKRQIDIDDATKEVTPKLEPKKTASKKVANVKSSMMLDLE